jgi:hypothetical protein
MKAVGEVESQRYGDEDDKADCLHAWLRTP